MNQSLRDGPPRRQPSAKSREARLRRLAHKQDLALHKLPGDGGWLVIDPTVNALVVELDDLNQVEDWLQ